jgi:hypothetical protein
VRSTGQVPADDVGLLVAAAISGSDRMHLRVVELIPPAPAPTLAPERRGP